MKSFYDAKMLTSQRSIHPKFCRFMFCGRPPPWRSILTPMNFFQVCRLTKASRQKPLKTDGKSKLPNEHPANHCTHFTNARLLLSGAKHFGNSANDSDFHRNCICTPLHSRTHGMSRGGTRIQKEDHSAQKLLFTPPKEGKNMVILQLKKWCHGIFEKW